MRRDNTTPDSLMYPLTHSLMQLDLETAVHSAASLLSLRDGDDSMTLDGLHDLRRVRTSPSSVGR